MQKIKEIYRKTYEGEHVNIEGTYIENAWNYKTEFIEKSFDETLLSNRAVVIGNGESRLGFNLNLILPYKTGPLDKKWHQQLSAKKMLVYGCNALYRDHKPDFLIATGDSMIDELVESGYCDNNIVYANSTTLLKYPGKFSFIPENPSFNSGALAAYIAAFDGHKKIYMLGFDGNDTPNVNTNVYNGTNAYPTVNTTIFEKYWVVSLKVVMDTYKDVEFIRVSPTTDFRVPDLWKYNTNFRNIDFRKFVLEADI